MSDSDRTSVLLLGVVVLVAVLVKAAWHSGWPAGSPPPPEAMQAAVGTVIVTGDSVNLRQSPARSAAVLAQAERGQELELLGSQDDWYNIRWGEGEVWLSKLYASPVEDCPNEQAAAAEAPRRQLPGEWTGAVQGHPATFVFYARGERLCAYVLYDNVKEVLAVEETGPGTLTLTGKRYERLVGATGEFSLDTFSGRLEDASGRLSGIFVDARNNRGAWFAERAGSASAAALASTDEDEAQMAEAETPSQEAQPAEEDPTLSNKSAAEASSGEERSEGDPAAAQPSTADPPTEAFGACPLPKCIYGVWIVDESTDIHQGRRQGSPVTFRVERGERVDALQSVIVTTRMGQARARSRVTIGGAEVERDRR
jgi:hypothetical protein